MKLCAGLILSLGALHSFTTALAATDANPFTVRLDYDAGGRCPSAAEFRSIVTARLGTDPFDAAAPDQVIVRIRPLGGAFEGRVEWRDTSGSWIGEQTFPLVASECSRLTRAMGFAVAVQIQLLPTLRPVPVPDAPVAVVPAPAPVEAPRSPPPSHRPAVAAGVEGMLAGGLSSVPIPGGGLFCVVAWPRYSAEITVASSASATVRRSDGAGVSQSELLASAAACGLRGRWRLCAVADAGAVRMEGVNIDLPTSAVVPLVEAGARFGVRQAFGRRLFLDAHADALAVLDRWTARLDRVAVWTAPRFTAAFGVGLGVRLAGLP